MAQRLDQRPWHRVIAWVLIPSDQDSTPARQRRVEQFLDEAGVSLLQPSVPDNRRTELADRLPLAFDAVPSQEYLADQRELDPSIG